MVSYVKGRVVLVWLLRAWALGRSSLAAYRHQRHSSRWRDWALPINFDFAMRVGLQAGRNGPPWDKPPFMGKACHDECLL